VAVVSEGLGKGATFSIVLPVRAISHPPSEPPQQPAGAAAPVQRGVRLPGVRVLVVDDEPDARALVSELLTERGALLERAGSANEAFEAFRRFRPEVVVSDIGMPEEDGFSLIRRLRALPEAEGSRVPALALTAFARDVDSKKALESGYSAHLGKPVDPDALVSTIAGLLQRAGASHD
jgi:CheY-like chemotaxis protein